MKAIELQLLIAEHNACAYAWKWDPIAWQKMRSGQICSSCRRPLPQPHTRECKRCENCARRHRVRMTFRRWGGWHCRFYTEHWRPLPKRLTFRDEASIVETARRGNALIDGAIRDALERSIKIGSGGIMLRLNDEQFQSIGGVQLANQDAANNAGAEAENNSPDV
jgi:hypothetical protein